MNETDNVLELLDMLYNMISEARGGLPFGGGDRCTIDRGRALDILENVRSRLPQEVAEAQQLLKRKDEFVRLAKKEGEDIRRAAEERAHQMVEEQEIVRLARQQADQIVSEAEGKAQQVRSTTIQFVAKQLSNTEQTVTQTLDMVRQTRERFQNAVGAAPAAKKRPYDDILD